MGGLIAPRQRHQVLAQCHASHAEGVHVAPATQGRCHRCHLTAVPSLTAAKASCPDSLAGQYRAPSLNTWTLEYPEAIRVSPDEELTTSQGPAEAHGGGREHGASLC